MLKISSQNEESQDLEGYEEKKMSVGAVQEAAVAQWPPIQTMKAGEKNCRTLK